jgi:energy-coupling factor transporter ATP-binding protein EcfA2
MTAMAPPGWPPGIPRASPWVRRVMAEMVRGRHVIVHGNVHDVAVWEHRFVPVAQVLRGVLTALGFELIGTFDQLDGLSVKTRDEADGDGRFAELLASPTPVIADGTVPAASPVPADSRPAPETSASGTVTAGDTGSRSGRAGAARSGMAESLARAASEPVRYHQPKDALAAIRRGLAQSAAPIAFILDFADLLLTDPEHTDRSDRDLLLMVKKAMMGSAHASASLVANQLMLVTADLAAVPSWLYRDEPFVRPVEVPLPEYQERLAYLASEAHGYYQFRKDQDNSQPVRTLANLTEGMPLAELKGLQRTSQLDRVPLASARELVNRAVFGQREDPWGRLAERIPGAGDVLARRVIGQPVAVERVTRGLAAGTLGIDFVADPFSVEARPKGVFFFAGPTGVGKTELCRALSELIFDDETALIRFDMSTFKEPHAAERLTGAPPGYVGHERGGELTNRVSARPFSVLLFDEIEKAHESTFDKFLQILEDGRLTDGLGQTTYFSQSLIIFTSNEGADTLYEVITKRGSDQGLPSTEEVAKHFNKAVRDYFTVKLGRPELLGRIGNGVLAFDIIRPEYVDAVASKFLDQLAASSARKGIALELERESILGVVRQEMARPESLALGYREVRNVLDRVVRDPLVDAARQGGQLGSYSVSVPAGGLVAHVKSGTGHPSGAAAANRDGTR